MDISDEASNTPATFTAADTPAERPRSAGSPARLEAFSDGVMAVIITIIVLDIKLPNGPNGFSFSAWSGQLSLLLVYPLSFAFIGIYWNNHHHLLRATRSINGNVMWANLHLLFWMSLIPAGTAWAGASHLQSTAPALVYGGIGLMSGVAYFILTRAILQANKGTGIEAAIGRDIKGKVSLGIYIVGILVAFLSPPLAYIIYASVPVLWFIPDRRLVGS